MKLGQRQIARSANVNQSTVHEYIERFRTAGLSWPLLGEMTELELERRLFPNDSATVKPGSKTPPDFAQIRSELQRHKHATLQLLWEEYRAAHADSYAYSRFCHHYQCWRPERDLVLRQEHRPGEKLFLDWAGEPIPIYDPGTGEAHPAQLFVAVLGASNYTYSEAAADQRMASWIGAHVRCFEFLCGCPQLVVPDNTRTGVTKPCRYEPDLNPTYQEMAMHYGVGVLPTRPRKPRRARMGRRRS